MSIKEQIRKLDLPAKISISRVKEILKRDFNQSTELDEIRNFLLDAGFIEKYSLPTQEGILYRHTMPGMAAGVTAVEMDLKVGYKQTGLFVEKKLAKEIITKIILQNSSGLDETSDRPEDEDESVSADQREAEHILKSVIGSDAKFRDGQLDAILRILGHERLLIVQRTGWGKSIVYFISTKILRSRGIGPTIIISPLLSLIRNQSEAARKLGLSIASINSTNTDDHDAIIERLKSNTLDVLIISPEQLANEGRFRRIQESITQLGLFVVDEAHCISDWGHDFRPDYRRIIDYVTMLPKNIPVLATTATANDRVVDDVSAQLGKIDVIRGPLTRDSLRIKTIKIKDSAERLAWLALNVPNLQGSGIIYCLTISSTIRVAEYLVSKGINARAYSADLGNFERQQLESMFDKNQIKCLVATVALGMGYDKPDIGFVIHYQRPGNLVTYYQQIGRAGRNIQNANVILLSGDEDDRIQEYFIESAFPTELEMTEIIRVLENSNGMKKSNLSKVVNMKDSRLEKALTYLQVEKAISRDKSGKYFRTLNRWVPDAQRSQTITRRRYKELEQMKEFIEYDRCYMEYISKALDDPYAKPCGKCANCSEDYKTIDQLPKELVIEAQQFIQGESLIISPRKRWPFDVEDSFEIQENKRYKSGRSLCYLDDAGYGKLVYEILLNTQELTDEVKRGITKVFNQWSELPRRNLVVTYIPSTSRSTIVIKLAQFIANQLSVPLVSLVCKQHTSRHQIDNKNSAQQYKYATDHYSIEGLRTKGVDVLVVDDFFDSRWTFTIVAAKLIEAGAHSVYPFALANLNGREINKNA